ncbi:MAG TPA: hypothetical protein RMH99_18220 [Sandaracinaceae bacterium LLY-WYZ-13_1]|nr:hypothetical protein [Sandaracinaceae bacterium LLY-WYZ-13_1]
MERTENVDHDGYYDDLAVVWESDEAADVVLTEARARIAELERICGAELEGWSLRCEHSADGLWARLSVRWCGVRLHVDQAASVAAKAVTQAFASLACLLEISHPVEVPRG